MFTGVTKISGSAFSNCSKLINFKFPDSINTIGDVAFYGAGISLELNLPNLSSLGNYGVFNKTHITKIINLGKITHTGASGGNYWNGTFANCEFLKEVVLPETLTSITEGAFYNCVNLLKIDIASSVTNISNYVLQACSSLESIICRAIVPPSLGSTGAFASTNNCPIYVPDESVTAYQEATNWSSYADRIYPISVYEGGGTD